MKGKSRARRVLRTGAGAVALTGAILASTSGAGAQADGTQPTESAVDGVDQEALRNIYGDEVPTDAPELQPGYDGGGEVQEDRGDPDAVDVINVTSDDAS